MKVKELIAELSKCDPEATVNTPDGDIYFIEQLPGYYDGHYEELIHDESLKGKCFSIVGVKYTRAGTKVVFHTYNAKDLLIDCDTEDQMDKLIWEFDKSMHQNTIERIKERITKHREKAIEINKSVLDYNGN